MAAKTVEEAVQQLQKSLRSYLTRGRTWRMQNLQLKQLQAERDRELQKLEDWQTRRKARDKEVLWRIEKVLKSLDRLGVEA